MVRQFGHNGMVCVIRSFFFQTRLLIIVTFCRWNELWLNEGFASYMSYVGANHVKLKRFMVFKLMLHTNNFYFSLNQIIVCVNNS